MKPFQVGVDLPPELPDGHLYQTVTLDGLIIMQFREDFLSEGVRQDMEAYIDRILRDEIVVQDDQGRPVFTFGTHLQANGRPPVVEKVAYPVVIDPVGEGYLPSLSVACQPKFTPDCQVWLVREDLVRTELVKEFNAAIAELAPPLVLWREEGWRESPPVRVGAPSAGRSP